jgi:hypothetical protein
MKVAIALLLWLGTAMPGMALPPETEDGGGQVAH